MDKPRRKAPSVEYDGLTINGKPILDIETVQLWFKEACAVGLTEEVVTPIAAYLNQAVIFSAQWKNTPAFNEMRENDEGRQRMLRVSVALAQLQNDLPALIDDSEKIAPGKPSEWVIALVALRDAVNALAPRFQTF